MAAERFFTKITQDVLDATERLANHLDDQFSQIFSGGSGNRTDENDTGRDSSSADNDFNIIDDNEEEDVMAGSPLQGMADQVLNGIMDGQVQPQTPMESFHAFRSAITWTEPFIIGIMIFHVIMFVLTIYVSRYNSNLAPRLTIMIIIAIIVRTSEYINAYASQHWEELGITQNYFDPKGLFMTIMICCPLLLNSFIMLCFFLREASTLLIQVKKVQLQKQHRQKQQQGATGSSSNRNGVTKKDQ